MGNFIRFLNFGGVVSCSIGGILALVSYLKGREARYLSTVTYVDALSELRHLVSAAPLLVAIAGRVWAPKPLKCELSEGEGAIIELREERKYDQRVIAAGMWKTNSEPLREIRRETEWALVDDAGPFPVHVPVQDGRRAYGDHLQMSADVFITAETNLVDHVLSQLVGSKPLGIRRAERYLPVGTALTAVGELAPVVDSLSGSFQHAIRSNGKLFALRAPRGASMILSRKTFPDLIDSAQAISSSCKKSAILFTTIGACMLLTVTLMKYRQRYIERKALQRVVEARRRRRAAASRGQDSGERAPEEETASSLTDDMNSGGDGADDQTDRGTCVICFQESSTMCWSCGHLCCCSRCVTEGRLMQCPVCRVRGKPLRVYIA